MVAPWEDPTPVQPIRLPRPVAAIACWTPFAVNVLAVAGYLVLVVVPWLGWFASHGTGPCSLDNGCDGPAAVQLPGIMAPLVIPVAAVAIGGPVVALLLGGFTVGLAAARLRHGRTVRRVATIVAGTLVLALAVFQMTPMGAMFDAWVAD
jgi:hypothetical protein